MLNIARLFPEKVFEKWAQLVGGWKWMKSTKNGIWFIIQIQKGGDFFAGTKKRRRRIYKKCDDLKNVPFSSSSFISWQIVDADMEHFAKWYAMSTWRRIKLQEDLHKNATAVCEESFLYAFQPILNYDLPRQI